MKRIYVIAFATLLILLSTSLFVAAQLKESTSKIKPQNQPQYKQDFRIAVGGGYANRLGKVEKMSDAKLDKMNKELLHGFAIDGDAQYFFRDKWGIGLNANYCSSSTSGENITIPGEGKVGSYKETQSFIYVGPSFVQRSYWKNFLFISNIGLGPAFYSSDIIINGRNIDANKPTLGINAGFAAEYKINKKNGVGLKLSYVIGNIQSMNVNGQNVKLEERMSVSNLMITAFISFRSW